MLWEDDMDTSACNRVGLGVELAHPWFRRQLLYLLSSHAAQMESASCFIMLPGLLSPAHIQFEGRKRKVNVLLHVG